MPVRLTKKFVIGCARVLPIFSYCFFWRTSPFTFRSIRSQTSRAGTSALPIDFLTLCLNCFVEYSACADVLTYSSSICFINSFFRALFFLPVSLPCTKSFRAFHMEIKNFHKLLMILVDQFVADVLKYLVLK